MKKLFLMGRSEAGKTSLTQILSGEELHYHKTQYTNTGTDIIDSPGEYSETKRCGLGLACFSFEADVLALLMAADEPFSVFEANCQCFTNRPLIGIITKIDSPYANVPMVRNWMVNSGCDFRGEQPYQGGHSGAAGLFAGGPCQADAGAGQGAAAPRPDGVGGRLPLRAGLTAPERRLPRRAVRSAAAALRRRLARG